jgi:hypothetical protein
MFKNRSTIDVVVILMTSMVGLTLVLIVVGAIILKLERPEIDLKGAGQVVGNILTTLVGALVGFVGGRATGRMEERISNGNNKQER